jgi:hypothetical protein
LRPLELVLRSQKWDSKGGEKRMKTNKHRRKEEAREKVSATGLKGETKINVQHWNRY